MVDERAFPCYNSVVTKRVTKPTGCHPYGEDDGSGFENLGYPQD